MKSSFAKNGLRNKRTGYPLIGVHRPFFFSLNRVEPKCDITDAFIILEKWDEAHFLSRKHNEPEKALNVFLEIADMAPNLELVNHRIANLYMLMGNAEQAIPYRRKELELAIAEGRDSLSASYGYLAGSLMFTDIPEAVKMAELAVDTSSSDGVKWSGVKGYSPS